MLPLILVLKACWFIFNFIFNLFQKKKGRKKEKSIDLREKHQSVTFHTHPDLELNPPPLGIQEDTLTKWATPARVKEC